MLSAWSYMFVTWFPIQFTSGEDALDWVKSQVNTPESQLNQSTDGGWTDLARINALLQAAALVSLCRDGALAVIWRSLCKEYESSNEQANLVATKAAKRTSSLSDRKLGTRVQTALQSDE